MSGWALDIETRAGVRDAVAVWLVERTGQTVEERADGTLIGFAATEAEAGALLQEVHSRFGPDIRGGSRSLPDVDWSERWREGLGPRVVGRLTVMPSWIESRPPDGPTVVIDPETAFGTGEHGSTRTALRLLDRYIRPGDRVLDLGSGSGIVAIAAVKLGASRATGVEVDAEVEAIARGNADRNAVGGRVEFFTGDAAVLAPLLGPVEVVVSNILCSVNAALLPAIRASLAPTGCAILAGMEQSEREVFLPELDRAGLVSVDEATDDGWWAVAVRSR